MNNPIKQSVRDAFKTSWREVLTYMSLGFMAGVVLILAAFLLSGCAVTPEQQVRGQAEWDRIQAQRQEVAPLRPTRRIEGMTQEQVRDQLIIRCASQGFTVARSNPEYVICQRPAGVMAQVAIGGPMPQLQLHIVTGRTETGIVVVGWMQLQAYLRDGSPGIAETNMSSTQRAEIEGLLASLHPPA